MTATAIARAADLRQQDVSRFFTGQMKYPPLDFLDAICRVFQYTLADVLAKELPRPSLTSTQIDLLAAVKAMSPADRAAVERVVLRKK